MSSQRLNHRSEEEVAAELEPLRDSVARHGVLQPLLVREQGGAWLVAGAATAFQRIGRKHLPAALTRFAVELAEREAGGESSARAA
jgi:ParB-like chromosome segregation protein Spo0J